MPKIGNDVWIGQNLTLNRGLRIGDGAVIAAYSVVIKDVPPFTIVGGNPAKVIKQRFSDEIISKIIESKWWQYAAADILELEINNPLVFLDQFYEKRDTLQKFKPQPLTSQILLKGNSYAATSQIA